MRLTQQIIDTSAHATEALTRVDNALPQLLTVVHLELSTPHLKAASYDGVRVSGCGTEEAEDEDGVVRSGPVMPDPIGREVADALDTEDQVLRGLLARVRLIDEQVSALLREMRKWQDLERLMLTPLDELSRQAAEAALEEARLDRANEPCCRSCVRIEKTVAVDYRREVDGDVMGLCRWCYDFHRATGALPTREELDDHHHGRRVNRRMAP